MTAQIQNLGQNWQKTAKNLHFRHVLVVNSVQRFSAIEKSVTQL
jgi:hypothetical protein